MELYNRPANLFVAGFIGSPGMNFVDAGRLGVTDAKTIGVRPEHVALSRDAGTWQGKVVHVEHLGADTIVYLESEAIGTLTVRLFGEHHYAVGDVVFATPSADQTHRFDAAGQAIR
jgi:multiple sugar transport system ATP-binding protein